jgi:NAD(P)-dependent dehydrogenase (short-subunit alcohol dehydrogenase family)
MKCPMSMTGRNVLVTGASSGIGRATAQLLADVGARVTLVARDRDRLEAARESLAGDGHSIESFDLLDADAIPAWIKGLAERGGPFHGLAHCAGIQSLTPLRVMSAAKLEEMYRANTVTGALLLRGFQQAGCYESPASVVFAASTAAILAVPANSAYGASKAALLSLARSFAIELAPKRIRINAVVPALVETEMVQRMRASMTQDLFQATVDRHPLGIGEPVDVANAIVFLLSDASKWITGNSIILDGGLSAL